MNPSQEFLRAAELIDAHADAAIAGPWQYDGPWWWDDVPGGPRATGMVTAGEARDAVVIAPVSTGEATVRYVALMGPECGKLLAAAMREAAGVIEQNQQRVARGLPMVEIASAFLLDLARAIIANAERTPE